MKKTTVTLLLLLIATNLYWLYSALDQGITNTYREASFDSLRTSFTSLLELSNPLFKGKTTSEIKALAAGKIDESYVFDKPQGGESGEDLLVVGGLIFHLNSQGHVDSVSGD